MKSQIRAVAIFKEQYDQIILILGMKENRQLSLRALRST